MASRSDSLAGVSAILAGVLIFAGQGGELAFGSDPAVLNVLWVSLGALGFAALVVAIWRLGRLVSRRIGRIGWRVCVAGTVFLGLFAVQALVTVILTGDIPGNFVLFAIGFLLLFVGLPAAAFHPGDRHPWTGSSTCNAFSKRQKARRRSALRRL